MARRQNSRDDVMSDCRSFGSNYHPCSQSRKISIGIMVDKSFKTRPEKERADVAAVPAIEKLTSSKVNSAEDRHKKEEVRDQQTEVPEQETSPWVSTRPLHQNKPSLEVLHDAKQASNLPSKCAVLNQPQRSANNGKQMNSVQFTADQTSNLQSDDESQKKLNRLTHGKKGWRDASSSKAEEVPFATAKEVIVPDKNVIEDKNENQENKGNESLRMKLWEVLGAVSTPTKECSSSQALKINNDVLEPKLKSRKKNSPVIKPRQNSDTIESDSDSPNHAMRRPVTRSLTRKRNPTKVQRRNASSSNYKQKLPEKSIFSFEEGWSRKISAAVNGGSLSNKSRKKSDNSKIEPRKLCFPEHDDADKTHHAPNRSKSKDSAETSSLFGNGMSRFRSFPYKGSKDSHQSPVVAKSDKLGDLDEPMLTRNVDQENMVNPSLKQVLEPQIDVHSPTLKMNSPINTSSFGSSPKSNHGEVDARSPMENLTNFEGVRSFKSFLDSKTDFPDHDKKNEEKEAPDEEGEHEVSPVANSLHDLKGNDTADKLSISSSEEIHSESSDEGTSGEETQSPDSPQIAAAQEPEFSFRPTKRCRFHENVEVTGLSPASASSEGTGEIHGLHSEVDDENELARAVSLFAMVLERVKSKLKSITSKKSAEILTSVAMEIHSHLQNAESQIQKDVGKLTSISKSKGKRLETRLQEQQEQLKVIYERFTDEVNQHLQDCKSTLEGLEAHQIEFKGTLDKQKASHRKLLVQAEDTIKTQLNDAQRRITTVHKSAREKMLQLKYVIAECLKEDVLD